MDFSISEEQRALVDTVRKVCQKEFAPRAIKYLDGTWPAENMKTLAEIGVLGMSVPPEYGGSGLGILDTVLVLEEIGKVCYVTAMAVLGEVGTQTRIINTYGPESIKRKILPRVATGEAILAICMTEPDAGTDVPNYKTNTVIKGDKIIINGRKTLISRADIAEMFVCVTFIVVFWTNMIRFRIPAQRNILPPFVKKHVCPPMEAYLCRRGFRSFI